ncbi:hypothetical protein RBG61_09550 [Paludicola sp. MB14-C6]|uniref:hypothetical protein n=1 Tax=Paludihabitans sp. MB14-C6 TaxID=3070656 RepID=UPI0027DD8C84|nr:hypothetical protein [Paludicola sp. MB14-C6]WMJ22232.1 hypothetical protein RBG61_09550 [Paludicola sp. MB14-C6]
MKIKIALIIYIFILSLFTLFAVLQIIGVIESNVIPIILVLPFIPVVSSPRYQKEFNIRKLYRATLIVLLISFFITFAATIVLLLKMVTRLK